MSGEAQFNTITGEAWRRALPAARKRRAAGGERRGALVQCPVCRRPGVQRGDLVAHAGGLTCAPAGKGVRP